MQSESNSDQVLSYFDNMCESGKPLVWLSTISADSKPHIVPVCFVKPLSKSTVAIGGVFVRQAVRNILSNDQVALASSRFDGGYDGYMIRGRAKVEMSGEDFDKMKELVSTHSNGRRLIKWLIKVNVSSVYSLKPGDGRKRIAYDARV